MKSIILLGAVCTVALFIAFAVRATRQITEHKGTLAAHFAQQSHLRGQAGHLEARLRIAKSFNAQREKSVNVEAKPSRPHPIASGGTTGDQGERVVSIRRPDPMTLIANDPKKLRDYLTNLRDSLAIDYGPHFKALGLSQAQIEKFTDVELDLERTKLDLQAAIDNHELDPNSAEYKKLWADYNAARVTKKAEVLGALMNRYIDYYRSENVRWYARELATTGLVTGESVTAAQIDRVGDILAAHCKRTSWDSHPGWTAPATINWSAAREQLKTVLSPGQLEIVRLQIERDKIQAKVDERTKLLTAEFEKRSAAK